MRRWTLCLGVGLVLGTTGLYAGCSASAPRQSFGTGGGGAAATTASTATATASTGQGGLSSVGPGPGTGGSTAGAGGSSSCAKFTAVAQQAPAALMVVLQASASMNDSGKWPAAQQSIVAAINTAVFDTMSLGMIIFPSSFDTPPACLCAYLGVDPATCATLLAPGVSCGVPMAPQIPLAPAGTPMAGARHDLATVLGASQPLSNSDNGTPIYDALVAGYAALKAYSIDTRLLVLVTDGGGSCTSLSNPARPGYSDGACPDWEYPATMNALIQGAHADPTAPISTFIVGLPGSNTNGGMSGAFANAPYDMLLALSTYAVSGSPGTVDPGCTSGAMFTPQGGPPAVPCHIDLSNGAGFNATALASAISTIRGKALGCVYSLPAAPQGQTIDPSLVNVEETINGKTTTIPRRKNASNDCLASPCWDYDATNQVELLGLACTDLNGAAMATVNIQVGCATILM